jgi:hypothetical protein
MSGSAPTLRDLLVSRLALVQRLSLATAALQRLQQARAGAEMDVQRCEISLGPEPQAEMARDLLSPSLLEASLLDARQRVEDSDRGLERCEDEIDDLESSLAEMDRQIETAARA